MRCKVVGLGAFAVSASFFWSGCSRSHASTAIAHSSPIYVPFLKGDVRGVLYKPDSGPAPHIAILHIARSAHTLSDVPNKELAERGFMVLAMNPRDNAAPHNVNPSRINFEDGALDVKAGVEFLRKQPGITKLILYAGSGAGTYISLYQAVAEKGESFCKDPKKLSQCGDGFAGFHPADGIVFRDAIQGNSIISLRHINPAVIDEDPRKIDPSLDPYNPKNGYNPNGPSHYSEEFQKRYYKAQAARMNRLIDVAQQRLAQIKAGKGPYPDDDAFIIPRAEHAWLAGLDPSIDSRTLMPEKLLKNDGTIVTQIVKTVRPPEPEWAKDDASFTIGAHFLTLKSFLSMHAIRATDSESQESIDDCSSNNSTLCALRNISIPVLLTAMSGNTLIRENEIQYEAAASKDKDFVVIEGATHMVEPCTKCESHPDQYSNTMKNFCDYVAKWINARF